MANNGTSLTIRGTLMVKLVPLFAMDVYKASDNELVWVYDVNQPDNGYHVPARSLSTYSN
jgi:hypothetical protein